jgi:acyl-CoA thioester hydrolase
MKPLETPLEKIRALEPACLCITIPDAYRDKNGHMNVRWYSVIFDEAGDNLHERHGLTPEFHRAHGTGTMDLENHISYLSEVFPGDCVSVYMRLVTRSAKRVHYLMFMVNETKGKLAAIFECVNAFVDLKLRKTAAYPPEIANKIEAQIAASTALDWPAPVCGAMRA